MPMPPDIAAPASTKTVAAAHPARVAPARPQHIRRTKASKSAPPIKHTARRGMVGPKVHVDHAHGSRR